jgi:hypothetical protein
MSTLLHSSASSKHALAFFSTDDISALPVRFPGAVSLPGNATIVTAGEIIIPLAAQ